jgi:hypothetical protein
MSDPVVWVWDHQLEELNDLGNGMSIRAWGNEARHRHKGLTPLYTHPPIERTLTDEVIADLWHQNGGFHHHFARAVERYLKGEK